MSTRSGLIIWVVLGTALGVLAVLTGTADERPSSALESEPAVAAEPLLKGRDQRPEALEPAPGAPTSLVVLEPDGSPAVSAAAIALDGMQTPTDWMQTPLIPLEFGVIRLAGNGPHLIRSSRGIALFDGKGDRKELRLHRPAVLTLRLGHAPRESVRASVRVGAVEFSTTVRPHGTTMPVLPGASLIRGEPIEDCVAEARLLTSPGKQYDVFLNYEQALQLAIRVEDGEGHTVPAQSIKVAINGEDRLPLTTGDDGLVEFTVPAGVLVELSAQRIGSHGASNANAAFLASANRTVVLLMRPSSTLTIAADFDGLAQDSALHVVVSPQTDPLRTVSAQSLAEIDLSPGEPSVRIAAPSGDYHLAINPRNAVVERAEMRVSVRARETHASIHFRKPDPARTLRLVTGALPAPWTWRWCYRTADGEVGSGDLTSGSGRIPLPDGLGQTRIRIVGSYLEMRTLAGWLLVSPTSDTEIDVRPLVRPCRLSEPPAEGMTSAWLYRRPMGKRPVSLSLVRWLAGYPDPVTLASGPLIALVEEESRTKTPVELRSDAEGEHYLLIRNRARAAAAAPRRARIVMEGMPPVSGTALFEGMDGEAVNRPFDSRGRVAQGLPGTPISCYVSRLGGVVVRSDTLSIENVDTLEGELVIRYRLRIQPYAEWPIELGVTEAEQVRFLDGSSAVPALLDVLSANTGAPASKQLVRLIDASGVEGPPTQLGKLLPIDLNLVGVDVKVKRNAGR